MLVTGISLLEGTSLLPDLIARVRLTLCLEPQYPEILVFQKEGEVENVHEPTNQVATLWARLFAPPSCSALVHILFYQIFQAQVSAQPRSRYEVSFPQIAGSGTLLMLPFLLFVTVRLCLCPWKGHSRV